MSMLSSGTIDSVAVAVAAIASVVSGVVQWFRSRTIKTSTASIEGKVDETTNRTLNIESLVNGRLTLALARIEQLVKAMQAAGIAVPDSTVFRTAMSLAKIPIELINAVEQFDQNVKALDIPNTPTPTVGVGMELTEDEWGK